MWVELVVESKNFTENWKHTFMLPSSYCSFQKKEGKKALGTCASIWSFEPLFSLENWLLIEKKPIPTNNFLWATCLDDVTVWPNKNVGDGNWSSYPKTLYAHRPLPRKPVSPRK